MQGTGNKSILKMAPGKRNSPVEMEVNVSCKKRRLDTAVSAEYLKEGEIADPKDPFACSSFEFAVENGNTAVSSLQTASGESLKGVRYITRSLMKELKKKEEATKPEEPVRNKRKESRRVLDDEELNTETKQALHEEKGTGSW